VRKDGVLKKLSNRVGVDTYALYTNYKSDHNGRTLTFSERRSARQRMPRAVWSCEKYLPETMRCSPVRVYPR
jgi:hypothetical protein